MYPIPLLFSGVSLYALRNLHCGIGTEAGTLSNQP